MPHASLSFCIPFSEGIWTPVFLLGINPIIHANVNLNVSIGTFVLILMLL